MQFEIVVVDIGDEPTVEINGTGEGAVSEVYVFGEGSVGEIAFSDGTVLKVERITDNSVWTMTTVYTGTATVTIHSYDGDYEEHMKSDRVVIDGEIEWYIFGYLTKMKVSDECLTKQVDR